MTKAEASFIDEVSPSARASQRATGIPASITIAQAILESGWGKTRLASEDFNYFGIKAIPGQDYAEFKTEEYLKGEKEQVEARFARYKTPGESFRAHTYLLSHLERYALAMQQRGNPISFALALQKCGYSTNPHYASALMDLVVEFNLTTYDLQPEPNDPARAA